MALGVFYTIPEFHAKVWAVAPQVGLYSWCVSWDQWLQSLPNEAEKKDKKEIHYLRFKSIYSVKPFCINFWSIGLTVRVFAKGPGDWVQSQAKSYLRLKKMLLDATLLNTQHYKVWIKGKVEQSRERSSTLLYTSVQ